MRPFKSEAAAWRYLARKWDKPVRRQGYSGWGIWTPYRLTGRSLGLCASVEDLNNALLIPGLLGRMLRRISHEAPPPVEGDYRWPPTRAGARSRAAFCRRMARLAEKEARA